MRAALRHCLFAGFAISGVLPHGQALAAEPDFYCQPYNRHYLEIVISNPFEWPYRCKFACVGYDANGRRLVLYSTRGLFTSFVRIPPMVSMRWQSPAARPRREIVKVEFNYSCG